MNLSRSVTRVSLFTFTLLAFSLAANQAHAVVTTVNYYHLGDADPGAAYNASGNAVTVDSAGGNDLTKYTQVGSAPGGSATTTYLNDPAVNPVPQTGATNTFAMNFNIANYVDPLGGDHPGDVALYRGSVFSTSDNFGIELWVKPATLNSQSPGGGSIVLMNGQTNGNIAFTTGGNDGKLHAQYVGLADYVLGDVSITDYIHVAFVQQDGVGAFYYGNTAVQTGLSSTVAAAGYLSLGNTPFIGSPSNFGYAQFKGNVDEVRFFTFASGEFDAATDFLSVAPVPEPSTVALLAFGLTGFFLIAKRQAKLA